MTLTPTQARILELLKSTKGYLPARTIKDCWMPDTTLANVRVQIAQMRRKGVRIELCDRQGPHCRGYRLENG